MKKNLELLLLCTLLVFMASCESPRSVLFALGNQTDKEIIIYPPHGKGATTLAPGEYFGIAVYSLYHNAPVVESLYGTLPVYISMEGVKYQVDRNQRDNCLWGQNYHEAPKAVADSLRDYKSEVVWVYELTEDYIKQQIVVKE